MDEDYRVEGDLLGMVKVPRGVYYGAQTQRAVENFPVNGGKTIGDYPVLVEGLLAVKKAAAAANMSTGQLGRLKADAITSAVDRVLSAEMYDQFPVNSMHGGGGTSANMNANEVIANVAEETLGGRRGEYRRVHPNDDVNMNQSTNDVYPTACHISIIRKWASLGGLTELSDSLESTHHKYRDSRRLSRTCLQDAVPTTYGDLFSGYSGFVSRSVKRVGEAVQRLYSVNLGGTIVGRPEDVPETYFMAVIEKLREATGDTGYVRSDNLFDAAQNLDDMVAVSSELNLLARGLIKIAKDLRLLGSGPEAGLHEVIVSPVQPGSSVMPGKVNPVIPEYVIQLCLQVCGKHAACEAALDHGELDLNVWESLVVFNVLDSMSLLSGASSALAVCVSGIEVDEEANRAHVDSIIPLLTDLMKTHGYSVISEICKQSAGDVNLLRKILRERGMI